jgi:hypothetical protein
MRKILIGTLSLFTLGFGIHIERINLDSSSLLAISTAEARRAVVRGGGRRAHRSVDVDIDVNRRGGAFVAGAVVGATAAAIGSRHARLPSGCTGYDHFGRPYYRCGTVYYQPVYDGPDVVYVVVEKP